MKVLIEVVDNHEGMIVKSVDVTGQSQKKIDAIEECLYDEYPSSRYEIRRTN
jgi:hypothetical protein